MKITELPEPLQNAVLQSAMRVMSNTCDMNHMLQHADKLLAHEFDVKSNKVTKTPSECIDYLNKQVWKEQCYILFAKHFAKTGYAVEHWEHTVTSELSTYTGTGEDDRWKDYTPAEAVKEQLSYWEP